MSMRELTYQVSFNTPAFLGNAEQQAQWRTPPFKALLRQWWRVVKAPHPDVGYDYLKLLKLENEIFGSAGDDDSGGRSKVIVANPSAISNLTCFSLLISHSPA